MLKPKAGDAGAPDIAHFERPIGELHKSETFRLVFLHKNR